MAKRPRDTSPRDASPPSLPSPLIDPFTFRRAGAALLERYVDRARADVAVSQEGVAALKDADALAAAASARLRSVVVTAAREGHGGRASTLADIKAAMAALTAAAGARAALADALYSRSDCTVAELHRRLRALEQLTELQSTAASAAAASAEGMTRGEGVSLRTRAGMEGEDVARSAAPAAARARVEASLAASSRRRRAAAGAETSWGASEPVYCVCRQVGALAAGWRLCCCTSFASPTHIPSPCRFRLGT